MPGGLHENVQKLEQQMNDKTKYTTHTHTHTPAYGIQCCMYQRENNLKQKKIDWRNEKTAVHRRQSVLITWTNDEKKKKKKRTSKNDKMCVCVFFFALFSYGFFISNSLHIVFLLYVNMCSNTQNFCAKFKSFQFIHSLSFISLNSIWP